MAYISGSEALDAVELHDRLVEFARLDVPDTRCAVAGRVRRYQRLASEARTIAELADALANAVGGGW